MRCHASAAEELILRARECRGLPGEPLIFRVDESWRNLENFRLVLYLVQRPALGQGESALIQDFFHSHETLAQSDAMATASPTAINEDLAAMFPPMDGTVSPAEVQHCPANGTTMCPRARANRNIS